MPPVSIYREKFKNFENKVFKLINSEAVIIAAANPTKIESIKGDSNDLRQFNQ